VSLPLPGSGFVYSMLKDVWSWGSSRLRGRRLAPEVFRGWTVDEWYDLYDARSRFGDPGRVSAHLRARETLDLLEDECGNVPADELEDAQRWYDHATRRVLDDLRER